MAIDCKLRGCDLVCLKVNDVYAGGRVKERVSVTQSKMRRPVRFEITETTRLSVERWIKYPEMIGCEYVWPSRVHASPHLSTRQYARLATLDRAGTERLWHPFNAAHQGCPDLQKDRQSTRRSTAVGPHENGQFCALSGC